MLEKILVGTFDALLSQGPFGLLLIGMGLAIWRLWKDNQTLRAENVLARQENSAIQEKRITESRESINALNHNTSALNTLTQIIGATTGRN